MSNKTIGNKYEKEIATMLYAKGYWVHLFQQNVDGQPCDIIVAKKDNVCLIDAKNCEGKYFKLERIEPNQERAMNMWQELTDFKCYFAIKLFGITYFIKWDSLKQELANGTKAVNKEWLEKERVNL